MTSRKGRPPTYSDALYFSFLLILIADTAYIVRSPRNGICKITEVLRTLEDVDNPMVSSMLQNTRRQIKNGHLPLHSDPTVALFAQLFYDTADRELYTRDVDEHQGLDGAEGGPFEIPSDDGTENEDGATTEDEGDQGVDGAEDGGDLPLAEVNPGDLEDNEREAAENHRNAGDEAEDHREDEDHHAQAQEAQEGDEDRHEEQGTWRERISYLLHVVAEINELLK